ncbi:hypothetical protein ZWY2020_058782 [Hordeum vulgare]|nr:hypothetical protein ZWY2020_058782 [Hordeum vulgare]
MQARLPKPPLAYSRLILSGGYVFAPATDRTEIQYCSLWYAHSFTGSGRPQHSHHPQRTGLPPDRNRGGDLRWPASRSPATARLAVIHIPTMPGGGCREEEGQGERG